MGHLLSWQALVISGSWPNAVFAGAPDLDRYLLCRSASTVAKKTGPVTQSIHLWPCASGAGGAIGASSAWTVQLSIYYMPFAAPVEPRRAVRFLPPRLIATSVVPMFNRSYLEGHTKPDVPDCDAIPIYLLVFAAGSADRQVLSFAVWEQPVRVRRRRTAGPPTFLDPAGRDLAKAMDGFFLREKGPRMSLRPETLDIFNAGECFEAVRAYGCRAFFGQWFGGGFGTRIWDLQCKKKTLAGIKEFNS